jgi:hypothetical protein
MKKKPLYFALFAVMGVSLTSCGYALKEVYDGVPFNSTNYAENYYKVWDSRIDSSNNNNQITSKTSRVLEKDRDLIAYSYEDTTFDRLEPEANELDYYVDSVSNNDHLIGEGYGPSKKLSRQDSSFKYGVTSKLFDGQMFCNSKYEQARVQMDEKGFGMVFSKEIYELPSAGQNAGYFALQFKASMDHTNKEMQPVAHNQTVDLKISFYCKNDQGFDKVTYVMENVVAEANGGNYTFVAFKLNKDELKRIQGLSLEYTFKSIDKPSVANLPLQKSLLIYEILMPYTIWR